MRLLGSERVKHGGGEGKVRLRSLGTWLGGLVVVGLILATAGAVAAQSTGVITGCVQKQTGALRISTGGSCDSKTENVLTWNVQGIPGPQGEQGPQGPPGSGLTGYTVVQDDALIEPRLPRAAVAYCPSGTNVLGGGYFLPGPDLPTDSPVEIKSSRPLTDLFNGRDAWGAFGFNHDFLTSYPVRAYAICADVTP